MIIACSLPEIALNEISCWRLLLNIYEHFKNKRTTQFQNFYYIKKKLEAKNLVEYNLNR